MFFLHCRNDVYLKPLVKRSYLLIEKQNKNTLCALASLETSNLLLNLRDDKPLLNEVF